MFFDNSTWSFDLRDKDKRLSTKECAVFTKRLEACSIAILLPSFCTPALIKPNGVLSLFIAADERFFDAYDNDSGTKRASCEAGPSLLNYINRFLKIIAWDQVDKNARQARDLKGKKTLFDSNEASEKNIKCWHISGEEKTARFTETMLIQDRAGKNIARLRETTYKELSKKDVKANHWPMFHLFQIDIDTGSLGLSEDKVYDLAWITLNRNTSDSNKVYNELQDRLTQNFLKNEDSGFIDQVHAYKVGPGEFTFEPDPDAPVQNHHPFLVTNKNKLNFGHLTDVHVSARQRAFKKGSAQVLQGVNSNISPILQKTVHESLDALKDLIDQMVAANDIDAIIITGDLIDYMRNFDPTSKELDNTGHLWEAMDIKKYRKNQEHYPRGIDNLIIYSLFRYIYSKNKPVFLISGNHEAYTEPYGISPRVGNTRPNYTIPADHNLTIYEAILLYGPHYGHVERIIRNNFDANSLDWFSLIFSPFSDYMLENGDHHLLALGWGDSERFSSIFLSGEKQTDPVNYGWKSVGFSGFLPRADKSIDEDQLEFLATAKASAKTHKILLTHFTFTSYAMSERLLNRDNNRHEEEGRININDTWSGWAACDAGTFEKNRYKTYSEYLITNTFRYTLAGHSHRAGLYHIIPNEKGKSISNRWGRYWINTEGYDIDETPNPGDSFADDTRILVSACGGPIAIQNYTGELQGFGLDWPSATTIRFRTGKELHRVTPDPKKVPTAMPRFAVALDFLDIFGKELSDTKDQYGWVFRSFESGTKENVFTYKLNTILPNKAFIKKMTLFVYDDQTPTILQGSTPTQSAADSRLFEVTFDESNYKLRKLRDIEKNKPMFLSIEFNGKALNTIIGYKQYNYYSPWNIQIEINPRKKRPSKRGGRGQNRDVIPGYSIRRHREFGEIPNLEWYQEEFSEYSSYTEKIKA